METPAPPNSPRREHRARVLKGATIITSFQNSEISCSLRNQHSNGGELKVAADVHIPEHFLLYVPLDGIAYRAVVRWRKNDRLGVEFVGIEPKPKFHYG
jgi:hypothetical protein